MRLSRLLHLADGTLPVGSTSHSYGLEGLVKDGIVTPDNLSAYVVSFLEESGYVEARCCGIAYRIGAQGKLSDSWRRLNQFLSAMQTAREMRDCSTALGRRFLLLATRVEGDSLLEAAAQSDPPPHHATAFGLASGRLELGRVDAVTAYTHGMAYSILAASQRLLYLGEMRIVELLWSIKPVIVELAVRRGACASFTPTTDIGSMRHSYHQQRLFIS